MVKENPTFETRKAIINALIHRVDVHETGFKIGFYVGAGQIKAGEAIASPAFSKDNLNFGAGSFLLQNGEGKIGINEPIEPVAILAYGERWMKIKINLLELVTLRDSGLSLRAIAARLNTSKTSVIKALRKAKQGGLYAN
jgi:hypothetical protein